MYKDFFRFQRYPFQNTADPDFFFEGTHQREALARVTYSVTEGKGITLITGEVGSGKTMLARTFTHRLESHWQIIEIDNPWMSAKEVFQSIAQSLGFPEKDSGYTLSDLRDHLLKLDSQGKRVLLIIDEAQLLSHETIQTIRLLYNLETSTHKLVQILLLAQTEFLDLLSTSQLSPLKQRISFHYHLPYFPLEESDAYIQHRLRVAGGDPYLFPRECIELIHRTAEGCPRIINHLCDDTLMFAYGHNQPRVTPAIVHEAIHKWQEPQQREPPAHQPISSTQKPQPQQQSPSSNPANNTYPPPKEDSPASPQSEEPPLPFQPPLASLQQPQNQVVLSHAPPSFWKGIAIVLASLIAGIALYHFFLQNQPSLPPSNPPAPQTPIPSSPPAVSSSRSASPPEPAVLQSRIPFPPLASTTTAKVEEATPLVSLVTEHFGAWNPTVRDLLLAVNPNLSWNEEPPPGTEIRLPVLSRQDLIVQDRNGEFYLFFATFENASNARHQYKSLQQTLGRARLVFVQAYGQNLWRLYIGPFKNRETAIQISETVRFKYLPLL